MLLTLGLIVATVVLIYQLVKLYLSGNNSYWPKRNVKVVLSSEVATLFELLTKKKTLIGMDKEYYEKITHSSSPPPRFGGTMEFRSPVLMITDLDLIKQILVKDFDHFVDRRHINFDEPTFQETILSLEGQKWKDVRSVLSPAFTTGKMKQMFEQFNKCGKNFVQCVQSHPTDGAGHLVIIQDVVNRFTVDVIGATAFGMETNAMKDGDSEFLKMARRLSDISMWRIVKNMFVFFVPKFSKAVGLKIIDADIMTFFTGILRAALFNRESTGEKRNDFLQLLVEARAGKLKSDETEELDTFEKDAVIKTDAKATTGKKLFTDNLTIAQSFVFFTAGFDTVGALLNFAAYLLAVHQDVQDKVYDEVKTSMEASGGEIEYETVVKLEYMDMVISEILRRYPPANRLERKCVKEYKIPDSDVTIVKDQLVTIPVGGIHMDPRIYPDPEKFDPERFSHENKAKRHPYSYLAFGMGPRNCIGMRFALFEAKVAIAYFVYYFHIEPTAKTPIPVKIDTKVGLNRPIANLELKFTPRIHT